MPIARLFSRALLGIDAPLITIEVDLAPGLPCFTLVGLPEASVREARERVRSALLNAGFEFPARRITVNLAPADLPKEGGRFDLPIALGILAAQELIPPAALEQWEFAAELALDGSLRAVGGTIPLALAASKAGRQLLLAIDDGAEAALVTSARVAVADQLLQVVAALNGQDCLARPAPRPPVSGGDSPDLADVRGQPQARRALEVAAAGNHNLLFFGPPGTGKTLLASRLPGILPPLDEEAALASAAIYSVSGQPLPPERFGLRPYRSPHHSCSAVALVGGGSIPKPGEISLAHEGILFLDELTEFDRKVLEVLREPLESGKVTISRAARQAEFPARFQLVAALNPSPCGHFGTAQMRSSPEQIRRYLGKLSGPFLDRFDLTVEVPRLPPGVLTTGEGGEDSATVRQRVVAARQRAEQRQGHSNAALHGRALQRHCQLQTADSLFLEHAVERMGLSARAHHRLLRVARTIADLAASAEIQRHHLAEALGYRGFDRLLARLGG
ncbi:MAG: YifB family Mg chelatase-like AAA ATPase [Gammaproteobacteria bacterium]|nr:YifB family Mg chelatase-like AAA ATPase [Gammaproteobacteria bacterium]